MPRPAGLKPGPFDLTAVQRTNHYATILCSVLCSAVAISGTHFLTTHYFKLSPELSEVNNNVLTWIFRNEIFIHIRQLVSSNLRAMKNKAKTN